MKVIVYQIDGNVVILYPSNFLPLEEIARKDVPTGIPFKILDLSDLPQNDVFREAWVLEISVPDGYGANYGNGSDFQVVGYTSNLEPIVKKRYD